MLQPALADLEERQLALVIQQTQMRARESAVTHLLALANTTDELSASVCNLLDAYLLRLPDAPAAALFQR